MPLTSSSSGFTPSARLRIPADFSRVFKDGLRTRDAYFWVYACPSLGIGARLGMSVARAAAPRAVNRNRIKRQVRESFRRHYAKFPVADIVVQAKSPAAAAGNPELRASLEWHWQELIKRCAVS